MLAKCWGLSHGGELFLDMRMSGLGVITGTALPGAILIMLSRAVICGPEMVISSP